MKTIYINNTDFIKDEICLCLGYFDGLHLGHAELIKKALKSSFKAALLTFEFENKVSFKRSRFLTSLNDKERMLENYHIDYFFILKFNDEIMNMSGEEFISYLKARINIKEIIVGEDFHFGKKASSDASFLKKFFNVKIIPDYKINGVRVSSTLIVNLLENGKVNEIITYLGRYYSIEGKVIHGLNNGHLIGFPTANMKINDYVLPKNGVYFVKVYINKNQYYGFANIGIHPTISELNEPIIEVHIFEYNENIYDLIVRVEFVEFIREEKKFLNLEDLKKQLITDKETCKHLINN